MRTPTLALITAALVLALAGCDDGGRSAAAPDAHFDARAAVADLTTHLTHADAWVRVFQARHGHLPTFSVGRIYDAGNWGFDPVTVRDAAIETLRQAQMYGADPATADATLILVVVRDAPAGSSLALARVDAYVRDREIYGVGE
jgi:hypothetical protein